MRLVQDDLTAARIFERAFGFPVVPPFAGLLVIDDDNVPHGAIILNGFHRGMNVDVSAIGERCWTVGVMRDLARYLFVRLGVRRVTGKVRKDNRKARKALKALGFREEGKLRDYWQDGHPAIVYGLTAREQKLVRI